MDLLLFVYGLYLLTTKHSTITQVALIHSYYNSSDNVLLHLMRMTAAV